MAERTEQKREKPSKDTGWDATTVLLLVGMVALAIAVGLLFN